MGTGFRIRSCSKNLAQSARVEVRDVALLDGIDWQHDQHIRRAELIVDHRAFADIGAEPYLVSSTINLVISQRLVRVICDTCKEEYTPTEDILKGLGVGQKKGFFKGKGCSVCKNTGYSGRIGIFELLIVNDKIRKLIVDKASSDVIKKTAIETGMKTLRDDGLDKVLKGITTPEEVIKATQEE